MKRNIRITCGGVSLEATLYDTPTTKMLVRELPIKGEVNVWGEEIYFPVQFTAEPEDNAREEVEVGTLAYWPPGKAFCIFFGPTPVSTSALPRAYSPVNIIGEIKQDTTILKNIIQGEKIVVDFVVEE